MINFKNNKSKAMVPLALLLGVFVGAVFVLQTKGIGAQLLKEGKKVFIPVASQPDADPDNDGLKNWEEEIYKTDKRNPDTDGDGYSDGEEVLSGYDPTKPAPDDALEGTDTSIPRALPKNLTSNISQIITDKIASGEIKPIDNADTAPDSVLMNNEDVVNEALLKISEKAENYFILPIVLDSEIKISSKETTKEDVALYIAKMSSVLNNDDFFNRVGLSEAEILEETVISKDYENIDSLIDFYKTSISALFEMTTPRDFKDIHKEQISIFKLTLSILESVRDFENDPATAAAATEAYMKLGDILKEFTDKLIKKIALYADK